MKIVRPYGHSVNQNAKRQLSQKPEEHRVEFADFTANDPRIVIAQWISVIDKIFTKPNQNDISTKPRDDIQSRIHSPSSNDIRRRVQIDARSKIGEACWNLMRSKSILSEKAQNDFENIWRQKLHPAGKIAEYFRSDKKGQDELRITGRWYDRFVSDVDLNSESDLTAINFSQLAKDIHEHLYEKQFKKKAGKKKTGLISARAKSVKNSTALHHLRNLGDEKESNSALIDQAKLKDLVANEASFGWSRTDEETFLNRKTNDLAAQIYESIKHTEENEDRIFYESVAKLIHVSYGKRFADSDGAIPTRRQIVANGQSGLLNLYDAIRDFYKRMIRGSKRKSFQMAIPRTDKELLSRLKLSRNNRTTNDLIRLGRIIHFEGGVKALSNDELSWEALSTSRYWGSEGQAEIKRSESFVRVWRNLIVQAQRTAQTMADPDGNFSKDMIKQKGRPVDVLENAFIPIRANDGRVKQSVPQLANLMFGSEAKLFSDMDPFDFTYGTLRILASIRNKVFHFKTQEKFVQSLIDSFKDNNLRNVIKHSPGGDKTSHSVDPDKFWDAAKALLEQDHANRSQRIIAVLSAAGLQNYGGSSQLKAYISLLNPDVGKLPLPRFNRFLQRMWNTDQEKGNEWELPEVASRIDLKQFPELRAKFVGFKTLYDGPFRTWVEKLSSTELETFRQAALGRTTDSAKKMNMDSAHPELIVAKAERLGSVLPGDNMAIYMDKLQREMASEQRLQKGYDSNPVKAREQSQWIEGFRMDILGRAFKQYIEQNIDQLRWLVKITRDNNRVLPNPGLWDGITVSADDQFNANWHVALYYIFHMVPGQEISRLLHQMRKWTVLEPTSKPEVEDLMRLLVLYLDMNNDKQSGDGIANAGLDKFHAMFEGGNASFDQVFSTQGSDENQLGSLRRGLREILRFGNFSVLKQAVKQSPIKSTDITSYFKQVETIEEAQRTQKSLHPDLCKKPRKPNNSELAELDKKFDDYVVALSQTSAFRQKANKVNLTNYIKLHDILLSIVGRLIDFAGVWERDGYFISLALMKIKGKLPQDVFSAEKGKRPMSPLDKFKKQGQLTGSNELTCPDFQDSLRRFFTPDLAKIRNGLHHFNVLQGDDINLTEIMNDMRRIMAYDRKLKNAIVKAVKDLLEREGILINWEIAVVQNGAHQLKLSNVTSGKIIHLKSGYKPRVDAADRRERIKLQRAQRAQLIENKHDGDMISAVRQIFL